MDRHTGPIIGRRLLAARINTPAGYLAGILVAALTVFVCLLLEKVLTPNLGPPIIAGVAFAAWLGGWGPAVVASILTTVAFGYYFVPPRGSFDFEDTNGYIRTFSVLTVNLLVAWLIHVIQRDRKALARSERELKAQADELARSNADLEQFAYAASHDLQEPLRMVASYTELLGARYRGRLDADADEFIGFAAGGAKRMQALINDLLFYSLAGRKTLNLKPVPASEPLQRALANLDAAIKESGAKIVAEYLPTVHADEVQLRQVFQNLVGNAIKFRGENPPRVEIRAVRDGPLWRFSVSDNGVGFDPKHAQRVFVMFQRLHTRDKYPGTGMGLALCKKIIERHGGSIWAESQPGQGSAFIFTLPTGV